MPHKTTGETELSSAVGKKGSGILCGDAMDTKTLDGKRVELYVAGKVVPIPEFLRQTPPEPLQRFVWQRMSDRADSYLQDRVQHMSEVQHAPHTYSFKLRHRHVVHMARHTPTHTSNDCPEHTAPDVTGGVLPPQDKRCI